ncbi:hypothetical protein ABXV19_09765 [Pseudomonas alkylphenolica]|uniref:hypothetical protein n=1 Tax=Pseudomonas alkylphenolica TaxID=237609 RepID=UPI00339A6729
MAKADDTPNESPAAPKIAAAQVFRDKLYTSRQLILPDGRSLSVAKGQVTAEAGDTVAQGYLAKRPDFVLQRG